MIVHNITTKVAWQATDQWLRWQQETFFPQLLATGLCKDCRLFRLDQPDEKEDPTYTAQLFFNNRNDYDHFLRSYYGKIANETKALWSAHAVQFSTTMTLVS